MLKYGGSWFVWASGWLETQSLRLLSDLKAFARWPYQTLVLCLNWRHLHCGLRSDCFVQLPFKWHIAVWLYRQMRLWLNTTQSIYRLLSPRLDLPGFWPGTETKREVWLLRTGFGIAPVNKLVSLTWLLWVLRSFRSFTLHYFTFCNYQTLIVPVSELHLGQRHGAGAR